MEIISIETEYVTEHSFSGLIVDDNFAPHYRTAIRYTHPPNDARADRVFTVSGDGETEFSAEEDALNNLKGQLAAEAYSALEKYNATHGAGNLEIA